MADIDTMHDLGITVKDTKFVIASHESLYFINMSFKWRYPNIMPVCCTIHLSYEVAQIWFTNFLIVSVEGFKTRSVTRYNTYHKVSQGITKYHKASQGITKYHKVSQSITSYHKVSQSITRYHKVSQGPGHKVSKSITKYHRVSQGIIRYHKVWNIFQG